MRRQQSVSSPGVVTVKGANERRRATARAIFLRKKSGVIASAGSRVSTRTVIGESGS